MYFIPLRGETLLYAVSMFWCLVASWRSLTPSFFYILALRIYCPHLGEYHVVLWSPCSASWYTGTRGNLMSLVLLVLSFLAFISIGLERSPQLCHPEWATVRECTWLDYCFHLFDGIWWLFFKWMLLNSYKIQRRGENLNKSQHLSLEPTPNISNSPVFCHPLKEGFNQHIFILRISPGIHISETVMETKKFSEIL